MLSGGCRRAGDPAKPSAPIDLTVEFAGCAAVRRGPVCAVDGSNLHLWVLTSEGATTRVTVDGQETRVIDSKPEQGGTSMSVAVPAGAKVLRVEATKDASSKSWELPLEAPPDLSALAEVEALKKAGKFAEAEEKAKPFLTDARMEVRARAEGLLARALLAEGKTEEATKAFEAAIELDERSGRLSWKVLDIAAVDWVYLHLQRDFSRGRAIIDSVPVSEIRSSESAALIAYARAQLAYETADLRTARMLLRTTVELAERNAIEGTRLAAAELEGLSLALMGRDGEARAEMRALDTAYRAAGKCERAAHLNNLGYLAIEDADGSATLQMGVLEAGVRDLETAAEQFGKDCAKPRELQNALTNIAIAWLLRGDAQKARSVLGAARAVSVDASPRTASSWLDLEGRIALLEKKPRDAIASFERLGKIAASSLLVEDRWRAAIGLAEAFDALGDGARASTAFDEAEAVLDDHVLQVPMGEGRGTFLARFERGAREHLEFLAKRNDAARAADVARRDRARSIAALRSIDKLHALTDADRAKWEAAIAEYRKATDALDRESKDDWKLPADRLDAELAKRAEKTARARASLEKALAVLGTAQGDASLATPSDGELFLVFHPKVHGWIGVAIDARGAKLASIGDVEERATKEDLAKQLLMPFDKQIDGARSIRVLSYGALDRVDFHALSWKGAPLVAHAPLSYGVDVAVNAAREATKRALVVEDPRGDLPAAREEARGVQAALRARGLDVSTLAQARASRRAVMEAINRGVDVLHYAGHGMSRGADGWESGLLLAGGDALAVSDVLALSNAPARVVLSGCDTATSEARSRVEGLGVAQAFLIAGAREVVASTRPVGDRTTRALMEALAKEDGDAASALRAAQLARISESDEWASFRVLVP